MSSHQAAATHSCAVAARVHVPATTAATNLFSIEAGMVSLWACFGAGIYESTCLHHVVQKAQRPLQFSRTKGVSEGYSGCRV
jgi:hypothetical protein